MLKFNNKVMKFGNYWGTSGSVTPPGPVFDEVTIGTQTWTAKNITMDDGEGGIYIHTLNYGQGDVVEYYYTQTAAKRIANKIDGWHLPDYVEMLEFINAITNEADIISTYGWSTGNGTNASGFNMFPAGYVYTYNDTLSATGSYTCLWDSSTNSDSGEFIYIGGTNMGKPSRGYREMDLYAHPLRLIKDAT